MIFNLTCCHDNHCPVCRKPIKATTCSFSDCVWMYEGRKASNPGAPAAPVSLPDPKPSPKAFRSRILGLFTSPFTSCLMPNTSSVRVAQPKKIPTPADIVSPWYTAEHRYEYFDKTDNVVAWECLVIIAKKRPSTRICPRPVKSSEIDQLALADSLTNDSQSAIAVDGLCPICFVELDHDKTHKTSCRHTFHEDCVKLWKASGGTSCPMCRKHLSVGDEDEE